MTELTHIDVPFTDYQGWPQINASLLVHAFKSWRQFAYVKQHGYQPKTDTRVGTALHAITECLPLERFDELFVVMPDYKKSPDNVTSEGKRSYSRTGWVKDQEEAFIAANQGREVLSVADRNRCRRMAHAISQNAEAMELITGSLREVSLSGEISGVPCKCRIDGIRLKERCLWDLKTTRDIGDRAFGRTAANLRYTFKLAFYWLMLKNHGVEADEVKLIAVQDAVPLGDGSFNEAADCCIYDVPMIAIENQFPEIDRLLGEYQHCVLMDSWPGVPNGPLYIPNWAMNEIELV